MTLMQLLPPGLTPEDLIVIMSALTAFVSAFAVWSALLHRDPAAKRAAQLATQREALRAGLSTTRRRPERQQSLGMMKQVVEKLKLAQSSQAGKVQQNLARAGWRGPEARIRYLFLKLVLPFAFGIVAVVYVYLLNAIELDSVGKLVVSMGAVVLGAYFPDLIIRNQASKRQDKIRKSLPDALDLMVICAEAGLSLDATLLRVSEELNATAPEIGDEFSLTSLELGFLPDRQKALGNLSNRTNVSGLAAMVNTLMQSERYGTPLGHSLRVLSQESRDERMLKAEEKAARLPALLTVPMIVFILPPLFIVLLGPAILDVMDNLIGRV